LFRFIIIIIIIIVIMIIIVIVVGFFLLSLLLFYCTCDILGQWLCVLPSLYIVWLCKIVCWV